MGLQWVRLDAHVATHDKVLALLSDPSAAKWQAIASYFFALGWSGGQGTDGFVPKLALPMVHGTEKTARLLEKYGLWEAARVGWNIRNFSHRQQLTAITDQRAATQRQASAKANCVRWHGDSCWKSGACTKEVTP